MLSKSPSPPCGLRWRSSTSFILACVNIAMFTDLFLYGIVVPILPFILKNRLQMPHDDIQQSISLLLAYYAGSSVIAALPGGYIVDLLPTRRLPFLVGLLAMFISTLLLWLGQNWTVLVLARIFQGISGSLVWTIGLILVLDTVGSRRLGVTLSSIFGLISVGQLIAPIVGGTVYQHLGEGWVYGIGFMLLAVDLIMRILLIEKKTVKRYGWDKILSQDMIASSNETSPLIPNLNAPNIDVGNSFPEIKLQEWKLPSKVPFWFSKLPILYITVTSPRILVCLLLCFTHAMALAVFDATIPLQSVDLFSFSSRSTGLLFGPLVLPYLLIAPVVGMIVDRYGTKVPAIVGVLILAIPLALFGTVHAVQPGQEGYAIEVTKFSVLLAACGIGTASISSESLIDESIVIGNYEKANHDRFPNGAPFAQLYALTNMTFSLGLTLGPLFAGFVKINFGFVVMNYCLSGWCVLVGILCALFLGEMPKSWSTKKINSISSD